ncbi:hypothetical protein F4677DRAFT_383970 [Hypoxylon crocopeplum]|nr:hypothetical protein F4677DRAFT_383970 [Hypoxylon crocopeplum]
MASETHHRATIFPGSLGSFSSQSVPSLAAQRAEGAPTTKIGGSGLLRKRKLLSDPITENTTENVAAPRKHTKQGTKAKPMDSVLSESPWKKYKKIDKETFGEDGTFPVLDYKKLDAKEGDAVLFILKDFARDDHARTIQRIKHPRFLAVQDIFYVERAYSVVFEHMPLSLFELRGLSPMNENCLAAILGQGLSYLEKANLGHGKLTCSNILIDAKGHIKIYKWSFPILTHFFNQPVS